MGREIYYGEVIKIIFDKEMNALVKQKGKKKLFEGILEFRLDRVIERRRTHKMTKILPMAGF